MKIQKITSEEYENIIGNKSYIAEEIKKLSIGEGFIIKKSDWNLKTTPPVYIGSYKRRGVFEIKTKCLKDKSGWAILRIK